ncbi:hypothetical protein [Cohnella panacarvi]|uniref:hypothetical protein n=1 Tax=Cohnella panacarvi TaxID=400776 RepID=UPI00047BAD7E|nr:hypothetical protein [Cohnella panacarvi]
MPEMQEYREEIEFVFAEASNEMKELPPIFRERAQALLTTSNPLCNGGRANRISYLLPYWMRELTNSPSALCRDMAVGNIYAMLRYFLLDDAMDGIERSGGTLRRSLALGQLLEERFRRRYGRHFPHGSELWGCYSKYVEEWATAVHSETEKPIDPNDFARLARKAAPVKLGASGLLLHAGMPDRIPDTEHAVDLALAVLQMSDDWNDWKEDLSEPNGNAFLSIVRADLPPAEALDEHKVGTAIYHRNAVDRLADIAETYVEQIGRIPNQPGGLLAFADTVARGIRTVALRVENDKRSLAEEGAFAHWLSKITE